MCFLPAIVQAAACCVNISMSLRIKRKILIDIRTQFLSICTVIASFVLFVSWTHGNLPQWWTIIGVKGVSFIKYFSQHWEIVASPRCCSSNKPLSSHLLSQINGKSRLKWRTGEFSKVPINIHPSMNINKTHKSVIIVGTCSVQIICNISYIDWASNIKIKSTAGAGNLK